LRDIRDDLTLAQDVPDVPQGSEDPSRRLVKYEGHRQVLQVPEQRLSPARLRGQEAAEGEAVRRQSRDGQGRDRCGGSGHRHDGDLGLDGLPDQAVSGVGDQGRSGIGDIGDGLTCQKPADQPLGLFLFDLVVEAGQGRGDPVMTEQDPRSPSVLAGDQFGRSEDIKRTKGDISEVADGHRDQEYHPFTH
ncbi:MAG TPA: hypothetical protein PK955_09100, partial [Methanoregulaceae archaeon]|nr:hypothetical protein [Methanoregulaceae archaeon]